MEQEHVKMVVDGREIILEHEDFYELMAMVDAQVRQATQSVRYAGMAYRVEGAMLTCGLMGVAIEIIPEGFRVLGEKNGKMVSFGTESSFDDAHYRLPNVARAI